MCTVPHGDLCTPMIYVDVDDTLVLYRDTEPVQHSGVLMGMGFEVNHELIQRVLQYRAPGEMLVVWSGGGQDYARAVVREHIPRLDRCVFHLKDLTTLKWISPGDVVVDDNAGVRARARAAGAQGLDPYAEWSQSP